MPNRVLMQIFQSRLDNASTMPPKANIRIPFATRERWRMRFGFMRQNPDGRVQNTFDSDIASIIVSTNPRIRSLLGSCTPSPLWLTR